MSVCRVCILFPTTLLALNSVIVFAKKYCNFIKLLQLGVQNSTKLFYKRQVISYSFKLMATLDFLQLYIKAMQVYKKFVQF